MTASRLSSPFVAPGREVLVRPESLGFSSTMAPGEHAGVRVENVDDDAFPELFEVVEAGGATQRNLQSSFPQLAHHLAEISSGA
ncbi:MAG: hypothetical protein LC799_21990 [Actinobacteria bacterium]|nr:hypothetical protein [Actinomycetota bacterium]